MRSDWEQEAENWLRWARTPNHDSYWWFRDSFFALIPDPMGWTLDLGCGEGRVTRDLAARGHKTIGIDQSPTLTRYAREAHPTGYYILADATALPFSNEAFPLVVAYCSLMDMPDMPAAVAEGARVLASDGSFCICVTHPVADAGKFSSDDPDATFVISGTYFGPRPMPGTTFRRGGLEMTFRGWCHSIEEYSTALEAAGLMIQKMREPTPSKNSPDKRPGWGDRWQRLPQFLQIMAVKV